MDHRVIKRILSISLLALLGGLSTALPAQTVKQEKRSGINFGVSATAYKGDLGKPYQAWTPAYHVSFLPNDAKRLHGSIHFSWGSISGQEVPPNIFDAETPVAINFFFRSNFTAIHYALQYNLIRNPSWKVYISQGLGFMRFVPRNEAGIKLQDMPATRAVGESYTSVAAFLPTQLGATYYFSNQFGVGVKAGWLHTTTDYIDNISLLGSRRGNDRVLQYQFMLHVPANF